MKTIESIAKYFYVGLLPNSAGSLCTLLAIERAMNSNWNWDRVILTAGAGMFNYLLGYGKYQEYRKIKKTLKERGWDERLIKPKLHTACPRHALRQSAKETGYLLEFKELSKRERHYWYHLLPKYHRM
jgi:hypothetical protein